MSPKVTLLQPLWATYSLQFGKQSFTFLGEKATDVPVAVAIHLQKKVDRKGKPLFKVEGMPTIVEDTEKEQNVLGGFVAQMGFNECLLA